MMNFGGWQTLLQINPELDYNWNIQAYISEGEEDVKLPQEPVAHESYLQTDEPLMVNPGYRPQETPFVGQEGNRSAIGFTIYKNKDGGEYEYLAFIERDEPYEYIDYEVFSGITYCYRLKTIYQSDLDYCESYLSEEACELLYVGNEEGIPAVDFMMYPNPAKDLTRIKTDYKLQGISVTATTGKSMFEMEISGHEYVLKTVQFSPGLYLVSIITDHGMATKTLTIRD
jgi:hypothetical protein